MPSTHCASSSETTRRSLTDASSAPEAHELPRAVRRSYPCSASAHRNRWALTERCQFSNPCRAPNASTEPRSSDGATRARTISASVHYFLGSANIIGLRIRPLGEDDERWRYDALVRAWGSTTVARKGALVDAAALPGFVAEVDGQRAGLVTYARRGDELEIVTIHVAEEGRCVGRALMDAVVSGARDESVRRIWLTTTNENLRLSPSISGGGIDLVGLIRDGVAASRLVKPSIPMVGRGGIPVRHELEFELLLDDR